MTKRTITLAAILTLSPIFFTIADDYLKGKKMQNFPQAKNLNLPLICRKPSPIIDIWKLEPILIKSGKITSEMTRKHKKSILNKYVKDKNLTYKRCIKGVKTPMKKIPLKHNQ